MSAHNEGELFLVLLGAIGFGLYLIWKGFKLRKQREYIEETPTAEVESVSIGPAELKGTAHKVDRLVEAPFSEDEVCLIAQWEIEEWTQTDDGSYWRTIDSGVDFADFYVDDGTGRMLVDATREAEFVIEDGRDSVTRVNVDEPEPTVIQNFLARHDTPGDASNMLAMVDIGNQSGDRKYRQNLVRPGEDVYVYGAVRRVETEDGSAKLVIGESTDDVRSGMFMISDQREEQLLEKRDWALIWRLFGGAALAAAGIGGLLFFYGGV